MGAGVEMMPNKKTSDAERKSEREKDARVERREASSDGKTFRGGSSGGEHTQTHLIHKRAMGQTENMCVCACVCVCV